MKKSLLALAVLAVTGAHAQSSVTMYGIADVAYNNSVVTSSAGVKTETNDFITNVDFTKRNRTRKTTEIKVWTIYILNRETEFIFI